MASLLISVVIPTFNPDREVFRRVLAALVRQTLSAMSWEVVIVDNASTDRSYRDDLNSIGLGNIRCLDEPKPGSQNARIRGIEETEASLIVFLDDDNILPPDYLEQCLRLAKDYPNIGCFGAARIVPEFAVPPAKSLKPYLSHIALRDEGIDWWSNRPNDGLLPYGAGLLVRREVGRRHVERVAAHPVFKTLGKRGKGEGEEDFGGEDVDFSWAACEIGLGRGIFRDLCLIHVIPERRIQETYLLKLVQSHHFSFAILEGIHGTPPSFPTWKESMIHWYRFWRCRNRTERKFIRARWVGYRNGVAWWHANASLGSPA